MCLAHPALGLPQWPLWHASIAVHAPLNGKPVQRLYWVPWTVGLARAALETALVGVGDHTQPVWETGLLAEHLRIPMTADEAAGLRELILARMAARQRAE